MALAIGAAECQSLKDQAESAIHQIYAVASGGAVMVGGYIVARAIEIIAEAIAGHAEQQRPGND